MRVIVPSVNDDEFSVVHVYEERSTYLIVMYYHPQVELTGDLVDQCIPGDLVTVSGVVKSKNAELAQGRTSKTAKASGLYLLYIKGNHILNSRRYDRTASSI